MCDVTLAESPGYPSVAVCLAAFNGVAYLQEQMDSILAQVGVIVTVFVSVDRSSDGTEEWFEKLQRQDKRVKLLPTGGVFGGAACNFFHLLREVDFSVFDYIAFADQDDVWLVDKLKRAHTCMGLTGVDGYSSDIYAFWESRRCRYIKKSYAQRKWDYLFESAGPGCTYVLSQKLALSVQKFLRQQDNDMVKEVGLHDWFVYAYARSHGFSWLIDGRAGMLYRQHGQNQVGVNAGWMAFLWRAQRVLSGWGLRQARLIAELIGQGGHPFVRGWACGERKGLLALALHANQCRRKPLDRMWFAVSCILLSVIGWK